MDCATVLRRHDMLHWFLANCEPRKVLIRVAANPKNPPRHFASLDEYFALEQAGDARYEYWDGEIVCMSGGSFAHSVIATNIIQAIGRRLVDGRCRAFSGDLPVKTPTLLPYRYPDVSAICGEPITENIRGVDVLVNPVLIVEVLSPSTERRDRGDKFTAYKQISSFEEYLLVSQQAPTVTLYARIDSTVWTSRDITGIDANFRFESIDCDVTLRELYDGIRITETL